MRYSCCRKSRRNRCRRATGTGSAIGQSFWQSLRDGYILPVDKGEATEFLGGIVCREETGRRPSLTFTKRTGKGKYRWKKLWVLSSLMQSHEIWSDRFWPLPRRRA